MSIQEKLEEYPTALVLAWVGAWVGAIVLGVRAGTDMTPIVDLVGQQTAETVDLALGGAGVVAASNDLGILDLDDGGGR